jgi:hypothetical protein
MRSISTVRPLATVKAAWNERAGYGDDQPWRAVDDHQLDLGPDVPEVPRPTRQSLGTDDRWSCERSPCVRAPVDPEDDVRIQHLKERLEVRPACYGEEGVDRSRWIAKSNRAPNASL